MRKSKKKRQLFRYHSAKVFLWFPQNLISQRPRIGILTDFIQDLRSHEGPKVDAERTKGSPESWTWPMGFPALIDTMIDPRSDIAAMARQKIARFAKGFWRRPPNRQAIAPSWVTNWEACENSSSRSSANRATMEGRIGNRCFQRRPPACVIRQNEVVLEVRANGMLNHPLPQNGLSFPLRSFVVYVYSRHGVTWSTRPRPIRMRLAPASSTKVLSLHRRNHRDCSGLRRSQKQSSGVF